MATISLGGTKVDGSKVALIIIDMWDKHWCESANKSAAPLLKKFRERLPLMRANGVQIIHAPSQCQPHYTGFVAAQRARDPGRLLLERRPWDGNRNERDDYDASMGFPSMGFPVQVPEWNDDPANWRDIRMPKGADFGPFFGDDASNCASGQSPYTAHTREHADLDPADDANLSAAWNDVVVFENERQRLTHFLQRRKIRHLVYAGVHTNLCVLRTRNISMKNMLRQAAWHPEFNLHCYLARDLTDAFLSDAHVVGKPLANWPDVADATPGTKAVLYWIDKNLLDVKCIPSSDLAVEYS